ncbi:MAG: hypothetical protein F4Y07_10660 [Gemmatimonadetes bacterium]|nr:hypothetical protein [Gemmatimonadota bacterium]
MSRRLALPRCLLLLVLAASWACAPESAEDAPAAPPAAEPGLDLEAIAGMLVERMHLQPGERVLLVGQGGGRWDALVPLLREGIAAAGGVDLGAVDVHGAVLEGTEPTGFADGLASGPDDGWAEALGGVDVAVKLPGAVPDPAVPTDVYRVLQDVLRGGQGRTVHFHWAGKTSFEMEELPLDALADRVYQTALLETDYAGLAEKLAAFEAALRQGPVRVTTPAGTDIGFEVGDRPVTRQDGDASAVRAAMARNLIDREVELPAGAARVSPQLETVEGSIAFPPAIWGGQWVEGLVLRLEGGRVVEVEATSGRDGVLAEMEAGGEAASTFRELAVGLNPLLAIPEGEEWIPYYGYGGGVVRLSLGDNTELGGSVGGGYVRWNFFTDATVTVGGEEWVRDGRLVGPGAP